MEIIISLSNTELNPQPDLTPQARAANDRAERERLEKEYAGEDMTEKEIQKKEEDLKEQEEQRKKDDPAALPREMPKDIGLPKFKETDTATSITNRHDNLPEAKI